ncbi:MAG: ATP synthase subunit I [Clostridia bacterium]|nr:ATP synthase subunit I [Clostridia bacterium]
MGKVDSTIKNETKNLAYIVLVLSVLLEAGYLIAGQWNYSVLLGNLLGGAAGLINFFLMGLGLQKALTKDVEGAKTTAKFSQTYRFLFIGVVLVASIYLPCFDMVATLVSVFFTSLGVYIRALVLKKVPSTPAVEETNENKEVTAE